ncbi:MAG TPA: HAMP domain-containing sensor histidine kinase, partial [Acidimicrobiales bacterium]|nr:HAMP domain-containing sensor histidine kinase [Acidimicrobiales bacterium]
RDELASLGSTLNDLLERLRGALSNQRSFVTAAGHELRTPLANLRLELELAARPGRSRQELAAAVQGAAAEVDRLSRLAEDLLLLAHRDEAGVKLFRSPCDVAAVASASVESFAPEARRRGVVLSLDAPAPVEAEVDEARLRQVIDNLADNALRYGSDGGRVTVAVRAEDGEAVVEVGDTGPGFPEDYLPVAFERFTRPDGGRGRADGGTGLGLAIVRAIVDAHGGTVTAANGGGGGAVVTVRLPVGAPPAAPPDGSGRPSLSRTGVPATR